MSAAPLLACGTCVFAVADAVLTPVWAWCALPAGWLLAAVWAGPRRALMLPPALLALVAAAVLAVGLLGPLAFLALAAWPAWLTLRAARRQPRSAPDARLLATGRVTLALAAFLAVTGAVLVIARPSGAWAVRWSGTGPALSWVRATDSIDGLRRVVDEGSGFVSEAAALRLARHGDPADLSRLEAALARPAFDEEARRALREAVDRMRGRAAAER